MTAKEDKLWTELERKTIEQIGSDFDAIQERLPHRTRVAIANQCRKMGLKQKPQHIWSAAEISRLKRMYLRASAAEICGAFPHSTWVNIQQVARYHGLRRGSSPYQSTGYAPLDAIREKCRRVGWSMSDLDRAAKTKNYFAKMGWRGKSINHMAIGRAIAALDGFVKVDWPE